MKRQFYLKNVIRFSPLYAYLLAIPCILLWGTLYYYFFRLNFKLSYMMMFTLLCFLTMYLVMKLISTNITVNFDHDYLYITGKNNQKKYLKSDIAGFYSYNYTSFGSQKKSALRLEIRLINNRKIFIESVEGMDVKLLVTLVKTLMQELNFEIIRQNSLSSRFWYSKQ